MNFSNIDRVKVDDATFFGNWMQTPWMSKDNKNSFSVVCSKHRFVHCSISTPSGGPLIKTLWTLLLKREKILGQQIRPPKIGKERAFISAIKDALWSLSEVAKRCVGDLAFNQSNRCIHHCQPMFDVFDCKHLGRLVSKGFDRRSWTSFWSQRGNSGPIFRLLCSDVNLNMIKDVADKKRRGCREVWGFVVKRNSALWMTVAEGQKARVFLGSRVL